MLSNAKYSIIPIIFILVLGIGIASASDIADFPNDSNMLSIDDSLADSSSGVSGDNEDNPIFSEVNNPDDNLDDNENNNFDGDLTDNEISEISSHQTDSSKIALQPTKTQSKLSANKVNTYYKEKSNLIIYLRDSKNKAIKNKSVKILLNGKTYSRSTGNLGKIVLKLSLKPKKYNVKISFGGDKDYEASSINTIVNVKKAPLKVKTSNAKVYYAPETFFKAKVTNKITKTPIEGIKVLFKVFYSKNKYKSYYAVTDKKGFATLSKRLQTGTYKVSTLIMDNAQKQFISYKNSRAKVTLNVVNTREIGCSSIYVHVSENESAIAFRRDSTYAADLYIVAKKWHGRYAIKQYKLTGTYFFHAITTADGWLIGTGGWDNPTVNKNIENLAGKIVSSNSISSSLLNKIKAQEQQLNSGHFAIVAPNGRYAVVWRSGYITGKLKNGEYLDVPNSRYYFRKGNYKSFSNSTAKAALKIAATDTFGINRRNIMTYLYKRTTKNHKTTAMVKVYGSNDKGNLVGRYTVGLSDNVNFLGDYISKSKLSGTPYMKYLGYYKFGNIDKLFKIQTKVYSPNITRKFNTTTYMKLSLRNKKTNALLKGVKVNLKVFTGKTHKNYIVKTDKNGIAKLNTKTFTVGKHTVLISTANDKYIISGKATVLIREVPVPKADDSANVVDGVDNGVS